MVLDSAPSSEIDVPTATPVNSATGTLIFTVKPDFSSLRRTVTVMVSVRAPLSLAGLNTRFPGYAAPRKRGTGESLIVTPRTILCLTVNFRELVFLCSLVEANLARSSHHRLKKRG